jgi:hypothetical protein
MDQHPGRPAAIRHLLDFALKLHRQTTPTTTPLVHNAQQVGGRERPRATQPFRYKS